MTLFIIPTLMSNVQRIAVLYNKPAQRFETNTQYIAAEDDTEASAREVHEALREKGAIATLVPITEHTISYVVKMLPAYDLVFNLIEWTGIDTEYAMQTFDAMDAHGIRYTGATKDNYRETCDKVLMKRVLDREGLPTAPWQQFVTGNEKISPSVVFPSLIKVASEHSSVGLTKEAIVRDEQSLRNIVLSRIKQYHPPVIAEAFLSGREFQVTLIEIAGEIIVLPPSEIIYHKNTPVPLLTYESRWDAHHPDYGNSTVGIAQLTTPALERLRFMCIRAFTAMSLRDYARLDIRCDQNETPYFLEVNSNPGLGDDDEYAMTLSYRASGMSFSDFVWEIVQSALRRQSTA